MQRSVIFGNSGSGKTTMARAFARRHGLAHLDLDHLAWARPGVRRDLGESVAELHAFIEKHSAWVIEGCYGDLIEAALPFCSEAYFLNPGVAACLAHCRARPWEPEKYVSKAEQDAGLAFLLDWVRAYERRTDEFSLARHRRIFDGFEGPKREITTVPA